MDKFETLEDYQNSLKEFNERTRKSYENFIQEHGDDSQKLQLRCTPYTEKKGRYGVASLDFGFQIWQSRQAEVDELAEHKQTLLQEVDGHMHQFNVLSKDVEEKDKRINQALNFINNWWHPDLDQKLFVEALCRALRGAND
ncbi:hypothetical protein [Acinetobacter sp. P8-3-8]|uniref:hypothetical protein n=1 Tax=Acinetobacter sp. P8-3-8 TaxID=1029823 RepID=UPI0002486D0A|nr:hypothetical protein [Acinetobacter sp. P8-3-8]